MSKEASSAPLGRVTAGTMMRTALALASGLMLAGCYGPQQFDQTAPDEFRYTVITEGFRVDDPESERDRLQHITEQVREHKLCPAGYDIVSRHATVSESLLNVLSSWDSYIIEYRGKCRTD